MKLKPVGILLIILLSTCSCERVIDVNLNSSDPNIVIEANIHNNTDDCLVKITRTSDYFSSENSEKVSGATIFLSDRISEYSFSEKKEGTYYLNKTDRLIPTTYTLTVTIDTTTYTASSTMPAPVLINYLISEYEGNSLFDDAGYVVNIGFADPEDEANYYRIRYSLNGEIQNDDDDYTLLSDELFNGNSIIMELNAANRFEVGDTVSVELMSIDKSTYDYFNTLIPIMGENALESSAPANPNSNFSNNALGYFSAYSSDTKTIIVGKTASGL